MAFLWEARGARMSGRAVYVGTQLRTLGPALEDMIGRYLGDETAHWTLVEIGAGLAYVAGFLSKRFRWKSVEAVELGRTLVLLSVARAWLFGYGQGMRFRRQDILDYDMPEKALVYCYLNEGLLGLMQEKGQFAGRIVVCLTFAIPGKQPVETVPLPNWQGNLRVYDFRDTPIGKRP